MADLIVLIVMGALYGFIFWNKNRNERFIENIKNPQPRIPKDGDN